MSKDAPGEMRSLLVTRESRVPTIVALLVTVVMMTVTMVDFVGDLQATDEFTSTTPEWNLSFETQTYTMQAVETLQDDESRNVQFDLSEISIPEGFRHRFHRHCHHVGRRRRRLRAVRFRRRGHHRKRLDGAME